MAADHLVVVVGEHFQVVGEVCLKMVVEEEGFQQIVARER